MNINTVELVALQEMKQIRRILLFMRVCQNSFSKLPFEFSPL